jgi:hypothetical protein
MRVDTIIRACAVTLVVAGTSMLAAPEQTAQPGQMTQARVWVQNRGRSETIPVDVREINLDGPMKVQIVNGEPAYAATNPVPVREVRHVWDYESITVQPTEDLASRLNSKGATGWETTGIWSVNAEGTQTVLLKRAR